MSVEDRVRRMLSNAVTTEPPPVRAPLEQIFRRRRRRPLVAATVALVLLLAVAVAFTGIRERVGAPTTPSPITLVPGDWKQYRSDQANYSFRYPPDWVVKWYDPAGLLVLPPEAARIPLPLKPGTHLPFYVSFQPGAYFGNAVRRAASGRLPGGQAYDQSTGIDDAGRTADTYAVDWGRRCDPAGVAASCGASSIMATVAGKQPLWSRDRGVAAMIVRSLAPLGATTPSVGDRTRPACRPDQWQFGIPTGWDFVTSRTINSWMIHGGVRFLGTGPACHLRLTVRATVERVQGGQAQVPGTPATVVVEGDLPEDGGHNDNTGSFALSPPTTPLDWVFSWDNWCRQPIGQLRVRVTAAHRSGVLATPPKGDYGNCRALSPSSRWQILPGP
jgi:hypothetical protein